MNPGYPNVPIPNLPDFCPLSTKNSAILCEKMATHLLFMILPYNLSGAIIALAIVVTPPCDY